MAGNMTIRSTASEYPLLVVLYGSRDDTANNAVPLFKQLDLVVNWDKAAAAFSDDQMAALRTLFNVGAGALTTGYDVATCVAPLLNLHRSAVLQDVLHAPSDAWEVLGGAPSIDALFERGCFQEEDGASIQLVMDAEHTDLVYEAEDAAFDLVDQDTIRIEYSPL